MMDTAYALRNPKSFGAWRLSNSELRSFRKEIACVGNFVDAEGRPFEIDHDLLSHWSDTFRGFMDAGIEVPVPVEHTVDPEARRATVIGMELGEDERGREGLFATVKFRDAEAEKLAASSSCSVYVPPTWRDGTGKTWYRPITHLALTDYPVIPGLDKFTALSASLVENKKGDVSVSVDITKLNPAIEAVTAAADAVTNGLAALQALAKDPMNEENQSSASDAAATCKTAVSDALSSLSALLGDDGADKSDPKPPAPKPGANNPPPAPAKEGGPVAASLAGILRDNRSMKIDKLVGEFKITRAVGDKLRKQYCGDQVLALSLQGTEDGFDSMIAALSDNEPVLSSKERSGVQALRLSHKMDGGKSPLLRDAERRASQARGKK